MQPSLRRFQKLEYLSYLWSKTAGRLTRGDWPVTGPDRSHEQLGHSCQGGKGQQETGWYSDPFSPVSLSEVASEGDP